MARAKLLRVDGHASGPRVYVAGRRVHHGSAGLIALLVPNRYVRAAGLLAVWHDRKDFPFRDNDNH